MVLTEQQPKKIYYGEPIIVSDMQGPCPDGFHVPLSSEWQAIINIWTSLGGGSSDGTNFGIALKLPFAGYRYGDSSNVASQGRVARYSTSNLNHIFWNSSQIKLIDNHDTSSAFSIRPFRNIAVVPTSSWTKLYGTSIEAGGIFWNSTDGLISLSGDGQNWITISDKNLGATEVWNSGDTLSEANAGKYYQSGNNYGFQRTGTISNYSYSQVNASNYGPGNYYSSPTFIVRTTSPFTWESSGNMNLRGGVTQGTSEKATEVKAVYLGEVKVRPPIPPYVIDYVVQDKTGAESASLSYYYGVAFTPNKDCTLDKVFFLGSTSGTLKIAQGNYASSNTSSVTYSISSVTEYELPTPYQLTANTRYTVSVYGSFFSKYSISMQTGSNVTFNYGTNSSTNRTYASNDYTVRGLQTTAT